MRRLAGLVVGLIALVAAVTAAVAQPTGTPVLVSGQSKIAIIDGNGDGPDSEDCSFAAFLNMSSLTIVGSQDSHVMLRACAGSFMGMASKGFDSSSNFGDVSFTSSTIGAGSIPFSLELVDETGMPSAAAPLHFDSATDSVTFSNSVQGSGALCNANGPAARVNAPGAPSLLVPLSFFPTSGTPQFLCIPNLPLQILNNGFSLFKAYIPVTPDGHITVALATDPTTLLVDVNLDTLPGCASRAVPAAGWGLIAIMLCLLAVGTWRLGRRPAFYQSLAML